MCCEECPRYDKCAEDDLLKEQCCNRCPEYSSCMGVEEADTDSYDTLGEEGSPEDGHSDRY